MRSSQFRLGIRLAGRELRRRPGRTALVLIMVLIPTGAMAAVTTFMRTSEWTAADQLRAEVGQADSTATFVTPPQFDEGRPTFTNENADVDGLRRQLGPQARVLVERSLYDRVRQGDRRTYLNVNQLDLADPMVEGRFGNLSGRLATSAGETVLTSRAADELRLDIGDRFTPDRFGRPLEVVGLIRALAANTNTAYVADPLPANAPVGVLVSIDHDDPLPTVAGWAFSKTEEASRGRDKTEGVFWSYVGGGVGLLVLGTVVTAAFAISARRQLRTVGLLSSTGAAPRTVAWFLVAQGAVAGAVGSALGITAGVAVTHLVPRRLLESFANRPVDGPVTRIVDLIPILLIGTGSAMVAAWLPARSASLVPTLQALAGRRPLPRIPRRLPMLGTASIGAGCALFAIAVAGNRGDSSSSLWALVAVGGAVAVLVGTLAMAPWVVAGLERACTGWSQSWRLAGRSLARSRVRSSAVVGAICAVAASVVAGGTLYQSLDAGSRHQCCPDAPPFLADDQVLLTSQYTGRPVEGPGSSDRPAPPSAGLVARVSRVLPGSQRIDLPVLATGTTGGPAYAAVVTPSPVDTPAAFFNQRPRQLAIATPELLTLFEVPGAVRRALAAGEAISVSDLPDGAVLRLIGDDGLGRVPLPVAGSFDSPAASTALPSVLVNASLATRLGLVPQAPDRVLLVPSADLTGPQRAALDLLRQDLNWEKSFGTSGSAAGTPAIDLQLPPRDDSVSRALVRVAILAGSLLLILAVVAVGLALAARDSEDERQVLAATGAPPRVLRRIGTRRAVLLVATAVAIAVPAGLLPAGAVVAAAADGSSEGFRLDLWSLGFVVAVLPLAVGVVTAAGGRIRDARRVDRPDVFAFAE